MKNWKSFIGVVACLTLAFTVGFSPAVPEVQKNRPTIIQSAETQDPAPHSLPEAERRP